MKDIFVSIRVFVLMSVLLGLGYPLLMTAFAQIALPVQANGEALSRGGVIVGSKLIGQKFESDRYFWSRPSAVDYNPLPSGGSNLGPTSEGLLKTVEERRVKLLASNPGNTAGNTSGNRVVPHDLLFASASGLDPHESPEAAFFQVARVSKARGISSTELEKLIRSNTEERQLGILGEPRVNVLALNLALDRLQNIETAPILAPTPIPTPAPGEPAK